MTEEKAHSSCQTALRALVDVLNLNIICPFLLIHITPEVSFHLPPCLPLTPVLVYYVAMIIMYMHLENLTLHVPFPLFRYFLSFFVENDITETCHLYVLHF